jgi:hypothetical protein
VVIGWPSAMPPAEAKLANRRMEWRTDAVQRPSTGGRLPGLTNQPSAYAVCRRLADSDVRPDAGTSEQCPSDVIFPKDIRSDNPGSPSSLGQDLTVKNAIFIFIFHLGFLS